MWPTSCRPYKSSAPRSSPPVELRFRLSLVCQCAPAGATARNPMPPRSVIPNHVQRFECWFAYIIMLTMTLIAIGRLRTPRGQPSRSRFAPFSGLYARLLLSSRQPRATLGSYIERYVPFPASRTDLCYNSFPRDSTSSARSRPKDPPVGQARRFLLHARPYTPTRAHPLRDGAPLSALPTDPELDGHLGAPR